MSEIFTNSISRRVGSSIRDVYASINANSNIISSLSTTVGINTGDLVDNQYFLNGSKITSVSANSVTVDSNSTNETDVVSQQVNFLGVTTVFTATNKSILIGGTFTNNTRNQIKLSIELVDNSAGIAAQLVGRVPVPAGSSFVLSDSGKTVIETNDSIRVFCSETEGVDVTLAILDGVN